jgi:glutaconate CoA-transferase subunit A
MEGFTHLIPHAAGHELIRRRARDLTLVRLTPDVIYDQMIGMGCASRLIFSWGGNPGVGSLHRFRDAVEHGWPVPLAIEEHSHAGMAAAYAAGAASLPFGVLRGYAGTDLPAHTSSASWIECPFTGERLAAVRALRPDVGIIHAQRADAAGNVQLWGINGVQKEAVLAPAVDRDRRGGGRGAPRRGVVIPTWVVTAWRRRRARPSPAHLLRRDNRSTRLGPARPQRSARVRARADTADVQRRLLRDHAA